MSARRGRVRRTLLTFETVAFGEVFEPPRNAVAFLLTARRGSAASGSRHNSANHATLRPARQLVALSVLIGEYDAPNATPRFSFDPPLGALELSASRG